MAEKTGISWCDATVNFWWGCQEVSPGCDHCYARELAARFRGMRWGAHSTRERVHGAHRLALKLNAKAQRGGSRLRVFTNSMSDFFDNDAPEGERDAAWATIRACDAVDWLVLTKRPQNIERMLPEDWGIGWSHVWLGVSAENQTELDRRLPHLAAIPAEIRWLSCEPLLGPISLPTGSGVDWLVVGGESGPGHRPCDVAWIAALVAMRERGVEVFVKQDSGRSPGQQGRIPDYLWVHHWPVTCLAPYPEAYPQEAT